MSWWAPDGKPRGPVPSVVEADVEGYGTLVAIRVGFEGFPLLMYVERDGRRNSVDGYAYVPPIWLAYADPKGTGQETTLILDVVGGKPKIVQTVPITAADVGREKIVDEGVVQKIWNLKAVRPGTLTVEVFGEFRQGLDLVAVDKSGGVHQRAFGGFRERRTDWTFPLALEDLKAFAVQQQVRTEVRFTGISLQPGHDTQVVKDAKELGAPVVAGLPGSRSGPQLAGARVELSGRVTDAKDGKPIERFRVVPGEVINGTTVSWEWPAARQFSDGRYAWTLAMRRFRVASARTQRMIRVEAEGYPAAISPPIQPVQGRAKVDFQLRADSGIKGVVQDPNGVPLAKAPIVVPPKTGWNQINENRVGERYIYNALFPNTDSHGRFILSEQDHAHAVMAIHDQGVGLATIEELRATGKVIVRPWAKIEGTFNIGDRPAPGQSMFVEYRLAHNGQFAGPTGEILLHYESTTDTSGRFVFARVPGLEGRIGRTVVLRKEGGGVISTEGPAMNLVVQPGQTLHLSIGGKGRTVVGRITLPDWFKGKVDWTRGGAGLELVLPEPPYPGGLGFEEKRRWYDTWKQTTAGCAHWLAERRYSFRLEPDGTFRFDDIPSGEYELRVFLSYPPTNSTGPFGPGRQLGSVNRRFSLPEATPQTRNQPFDLGGIALNVTSLPTDTK